MKNELFGCGSVRLTSSASVSESESVSRTLGSFESDTDTDAEGSPSRFEMLQIGLRAQPAGNIEGLAEAEQSGY